MITACTVLCSEDRWFKNTTHSWWHALNANGVNVYVLSDEAYKFTLFGAINRAYGKGRSVSMIRRVILALPAEWQKHVSPLTDFSNAPGTTYQDIINLLKDAGV